jgi:hypothetical protein
MPILAFPAVHIPFLRVQGFKGSSEILKHYRKLKKVQEDPVDVVKNSPGT